MVDIAVTANRGTQIGLAQPAILVLRREAEVLEYWAIEPGIVNPSPL
jgi:hypothetical protein